jgi:D-serine deaminase-like pyridoxal phosphate-dependent protein
LHWYDGHIRQSDLTERTVACRAGWERLICFRDALLLSGLPVPRIVAAGTGSFPVLAEVDEPGLELSAGTVVYWDANYRRLYPDLPFIPALGILTRVVSCNRSGYLTLDLGHKACAADPPAGQRLEFPAWPDAREVMHHEEHLVVETRSAGQWRNGDWTIALPAHVCPTSALHEHATVISGRRIVERWRIAARTRELMSADET